MTTGSLDVEPVAITIDLDWAPDYAIDLVADAMIERKIHATWFVTHDSPAVARLRAHDDLFELGIHPNFASRSTHGRTLERVLAHCMRLVPEATAMRTHHLYQLTPLFEMVLERTPIRADLSLYLHRAPHLAPVAFHGGGRTLHRLPTFWQDDQAMREPRPCWDVTELLATPGLKIMNFHPMHVYLNSGSFEGYGSLRDRAPVLSELPKAVARAHVRAGPGTATLFAALLSRLDGRATWRIRDFVAQLEQTRAALAR